VAKPPVSERVDNGPSTLTASTGTPRSFIGVGGVILRADEWVGEGADAHLIVLMLHGGGQTRHSWKSTGAKLAAMGYHVVALDSRAMARATGPRTPTTVSRRWLPTC